MCTKANLKSVVDDYRSLRTLKDELEEQLKALEREMIGYLDNNQLLSESGEDFVIKVATCERRTIDTKQLEADLGSLSEYQRITQYRRLTVR